MIAITAISQTMKMSISKSKTSPERMNFQMSWKKNVGEQVPSILVKPKSIFHPSIEPPLSLIRLTSIQQMWTICVGSLPPTTRMKTEKCMLCNALFDPKYAKAQSLCFLRERPFMESFEGENKNKTKRKQITIADHMKTSKDNFG